MARQPVSLGAFNRGISPAAVCGVWELFPSIRRYRIDIRRS
jgi:hypothetical protein